MAKTKVWFEIYGDGQIDKNILLAKVKSKGLAYIVKDMYQNITIK